MLCTDIQYVYSSISKPSLSAIDWRTEKERERERLGMNGKWRLSSTLPENDPPPSSNTPPSPLQIKEITQMYTYSVQAYYQYSRNRYRYRYSTIPVYFISMLGQRKRGGIGEGGKKGRGMGEEGGKPNLTVAVLTQGQNGLDDCEGWWREGILVGNRKGWGNIGMIQQGRGEYW